VSDRVHVSIEDGVADVRLARADKLNALDLPMFQALVETGRSLAENDSLRAVALSGEGRAFCAGLDFQSFSAMAGTGEAQRGPSLLDRGEESPANLAQRAAWIWKELPVPVIAALHGVVYGGGLQIALAADLRLVAPDAKLSVREVHWGLIPDMSGTQTLRHLVGLDVAKELTYTARIVFGTEAAVLGLATRTSERPHEEALELAREIASRSPHAVRAAKRLLDATVVSSVEDGLLLEEKIQRSLLGQPNQIEAVRANMEKRPPKFEDPA
jgi:enoyl-CoA hydratase/carnithine racemase